MQSSVVLDLFFLLIALLMAFISAKRGFIQSVIHSAKWLLGLIFAYFFGGKLGSLIGTAFLEKPIYNFVYQKMDVFYRENTAAFNVESVMERLPDFLLGEELRNRFNAIQGSGEELVSSLSKEIALPISNLLSNILGYIGVFVISVLGLWLLSKLLTGLMDKIRILGAANHILGAAWGILMAMPVLLVLASVIKLFYGENTIYTESVIVKLLGESSILDFLHIFNVGSLWLTNLFG